MASMGPSFKDSKADVSTNVASKDEPKVLITDPQDIERVGVAGKRKLVLK